MKLHLIQCSLSHDYWLVGAAFSRDLHGQSRLKTDPTIQKQLKYTYKVSSSIKLVAFQASGCAEL